MSEDPTLWISGCRSDFEVGSLLGDIQIDGWKGISSIPAAALALDSGDADAKAHRAEMITAVRGGKHLSLAVNALTFRQRPAPNRLYLRLAADKLADRAPTWKGQPFLQDHNTYSMKASHGLIAASKMVQESTNIAAFDQVLHAVTPEAVIGFLNGTWRKFSVGWFALGPVTCSVHECDVRSADSCSCWPGETVMVDGKPKVVEYEFSDYEGKEVSTVVIPAVRDTSVSDIRAALTAELHLPARRSTPPKEQKKMAAFPRLAAVLGLTELSEAEEARAVTIAEGLRTGKLAAEQERDTARTELTAARKERDDALAARAAGKTDDLIAGAYRDGKLKWGRDDKGAATPSPRETRLRKIAKADGLDALTAEIAELEVIVPVGQRQIAQAGAEPEKTSLTSVPTDAQLAAMAIKIGVPLNDLRAQYGMAPIAVAGGTK